MAAAEILSRLNPQMTFIYVSGRGTDSSERGRIMWARVKGKTENALLRTPFKAAYMFRPGVIEPRHGATSKTPLYNVFYTLGKPLLPLFRLAFPGQILTTEEVGRAMLTIARRGFPKKLLEIKDIQDAAKPRESSAIPYTKKIRKNSNALCRRFGSPNTILPRQHVGISID